MAEKRLVQLTRPVPYLFQGPANDCGPFALAMVLGGFWPERFSPQHVMSLMRRLRVPMVGATLPWAISVAGSRCGLHVHTHWFGTLDEVKRWVERDCPVLVIVHPDDFRRCPWYALHYRVVVGFRDDADLPGGGELYFRCSAAPPCPGGEAPGNVTLSHADFQRQWRTWLTPNWYAAVWPAERRSPV
ncbi:MAG: C39 family peptidase [Chloroflexi bacterium]|nr:C39 family peptidase [Chloroflexota bacterium]